MPLLYRWVVPNVPSWTGGNGQLIYDGNSLVRRTLMRMRIKSVDVTLSVSGRLVDECGWPSSISGGGMGPSDWTSWSYGGAGSVEVVQGVRIRGAELSEVSGSAQGSTVLPTRPSCEDGLGFTGVDTTGQHTHRWTFLTESGPNSRAWLRMGVGFEWSSGLSEARWVAVVRGAGVSFLKSALCPIGGMFDTSEEIWGGEVWNTSMVAGNIKFLPRIRIGGDLEFDVTFPAEDFYIRNNLNSRDGNPYDYTDYDAGSVSMHVCVENEVDPSELPAQQ